MGHESNKSAEIKISDSGENFDTWINRKYISEETRSVLQNVDVLLVPLEGFREEAPLTFPVGTEEVLAFLKENLPQESKVDVCIENKDYKELALHSSLVTLGILVVKKVFSKVVIDVLADYVKRTIIQRKQKRAVKVSITIVDETGASKNLTYEGDAENFGVIKNALTKLDQND